MFGTAMKKTGVEVFTGKDEMALEQKQPKESKQHARQLLIISVSAVCLTAIISAVVIATVYITQKKAADLTIETLKFQVGDKMESETIKMNQDKQIYEVVLTEQKAHLVTDYGKRLMSGKIVIGQTEKCFVMPLIGKGISMLDAAMAQGGDKMSNRTVNLMLETVPINDISFIPSETKAICGNQKLYWATADTITGEENSGRKISKRKAPVIDAIIVVHHKDGSRTVYIIYHDE